MARKFTDRTLAEEWKNQIGSILENVRAVAGEQVLEGFDAPALLEAIPHIRRAFDELGGFIKKQEREDGVP